MPNTKNNIKLPAIRDLSKDITVKYVQYPDHERDNDGEETPYPQIALMVFDHGGYKLVTHAEAAYVVNDEKTGKPLVSFTPHVLSKFVARHRHDSNRSVAKEILEHVREALLNNDWTRPVTKSKNRGEDDVTSGPPVAYDAFSDPPGKPILESAGVEPEHGARVVLENNLVAFYVAEDAEKPAHLTSLRMDSWAVFGDGPNILRDDLLKDGLTLDEAKEFAQTWSW